MNNFSDIKKIFAKIQQIKFTTNSKHEYFVSQIFSILFLISGICTARFGLQIIRNPQTLIMILGSLLPAILFIKAYKDRLIIFIIAFLIGFTSWQFASKNFAKHQIDSYHNDVNIRGIIKDISLREDGAKFGISVIPSKTNPNNITNLLVTCKLEECKTLNSGDEVELNGQMFGLPNPYYPTAYSYASQAEYLGYEGMFKVLHLTNIKYNNLDDWSEKLRKITRKYASKYMNQDSLGVFLAMMIGDRYMIKREINDTMQISGISHILSVSGLHMVIVVGIFLVGMRFLLSRFEWLTLRFAIKTYGAIIGLCFAFFYLQLAQSPIPAVRSFIMIAIVALGVIFARTYSSSHALWIACFTILIIRPFEIFFASFQLSFIAVLSVSFAYRLVYSNNILQTSDVKPIIKILRSLVWISISSVFVTLITAPSVIYFFGKISFGGVIANILALPLVSFVVMPIGFVCTLASWLNETLVSYNLHGFTLLCRFLFIVAMYSIKILIFIGDICAKIPSTLIFKHFWGDCLFGFLAGFLYLSISRINILRLYGLTLCAAVILLWAVRPTPNLIFDSTSIAFKMNGQYYLGGDKNLYKQNTWLTELGQDHFTELNLPETSKEIGLFCEADYCTIFDNKILLLIKNKERTPLATECKQYKHIITFYKSSRLICTDGYYKNVFWSSKIYKTGTQTLQVK